MLLELFIVLSVAAVLAIWYVSTVAPAMAIELAIPTIGLAAFTATAKVALGA